MHYFFFAGLMLLLAFFIIPLVYVLLIVAQTTLPMRFETPRGKTTAVLGGSFLLHTFVIALISIAGEVKITEAISVSLLVSYPLIACYGMLYLLKDKAEIPGVIFYWSFVGAYVANLWFPLSLLVDFMLTPAVLRDLGPSEDYWLSLVTAGVFRTSALGLLAGASCSILYYVPKNRKNRITKTVTLKRTTNK